MFLNIACILALFDIEAPANEKLEAHFPDTGMVRYVHVPPMHDLLGSHGG